MRFAVRAKITLEIKTMVTARSLDSTIINYIYIITPHEEVIHLKVVSFPYTAVCKVTIRNPKINDCIVLKLLMTR